jgi:hypothetical protein
MASLDGSKQALSDNHEENLAIVPGQKVFTIGKDGSPRPRIYLGRFRHLCPLTTQNLNPQKPNPLNPKPLQWWDVPPEAVVRLEGESSLMDALAGVKRMVISLLPQMSMSKF